MVSDVLPRDLRTRISLKRSTCKAATRQQGQATSAIDKRDQRALRLLQDGHVLAAKKAASCGRAEVLLRYGQGLEAVRLYACVGEGCAERCCSSRRARRNTRDDFRLLDVVIPEARACGYIVGLGTLTTPRPDDLDHVDHARVVAERAKEFYAWAMKEGHLVGAKRRGEISCDTCFAHCHGAWAVRSARSLKAMRAKWVEMNPGCIAKYAFNFSEQDSRGKPWNAPSLAGYTNKGAVANGVRKLSSEQYGLYLDVVLAFPSLTATLGSFRASPSVRSAQSEWEHYTDCYGKRRRRRRKPPPPRRRVSRRPDTPIKAVIAAEVASQHSKYVDERGIAHHVDYNRARVRWLDGVAPELVRRLEAPQHDGAIASTPAPKHRLPRSTERRRPRTCHLVVSHGARDGLHDADVHEADVHEADVHRFDLDPSFF